MKNQKINGGLVYSTNPEVKIQNNEEEESPLMPPSGQDLRVELNKKLKAGKTATLITGFMGPELALQDLGKKVKSFCATGGSVKDGIIILQGDFRDKILGWLIKEGFKAKKSGG